MALFCVFIGLCGFLGMTVAFPLFARLIHQEKGESKQQKIQSITVLIPAHNEELTLAETLSSIKTAFQGQGLAFQIIVGADGCSDNTKSVAESFGAKVIEESAAIGKWQMLNKLVAYSEEKDWIALVDSGSLWQKDLISLALPFIEDGSVVGVAPSYGNPHGGVSERILWRIERYFKLLEIKAGGPISIHGATVFYRAEALRRALSFLKGKKWLNDDVVIPLTIRAFCTKSKIHYLETAIVSDQGERGGSLVHTHRGLKRRLRLVIGNLQWIKQVWTPLFSKNKTAGILAMRRIFRVFWGYWFFLVFLGLLLLFFASSHFVTLITLVILFLILLYVGCVISSPAKNLIEAFVASLMAPLLWFSGSSKDVHWK